MITEYDLFRHFMDTIYPNKKIQNDTYDSSIIADVKKVAKLIKVELKKPYVAYNTALRDHNSTIN